MTDVASLGFDIDTSALTKANTELKTLVQVSGQADQAVAKLSVTVNSIGKNAAANVNALSVSMSKVATSAGSAAAAVSAANASMVAGTNASTVATTAGIAAATRGAAAQTAAAVAVGVAATAHTGLAANTNKSAVATAANGAEASIASGIYNLLFGSVTKSTTGILAHTDASKLATQATNGLSAGFNVVRDAALAVAAAVGISGIAALDALNKWTQLNNAMRIANVTGSDTVLVQQKLFDIADRAGIPIGEVINLYQRQSTAAHTLGASQSDMIKIIDTVAASLRIQGTSTEGARGALLQLSQSFESGIVHSQEWNSLTQNAYPLLQAAARGMDGMNGSVSKLQAAVKAGQITSKQFFDAILKGGADTIAMSQSMNLSIGASFNATHNSFIEMIGKIDDATGISKTFSAALQDLGHWMQDLGNNKDFLDGVNSAFQAFLGVVKLVKDAVDAVVSSIMAVANAVKTLLGEKAIADMKGGGVTTDSNGVFVMKKGVDDFNVALQNSYDLNVKLQDQYNNQLAQVTARGADATGAALKNLEDTKAEWKKAYAVFQSIKADRDALDKAISNKTIETTVKNTPFDADDTGVPLGPNTSTLDTKSKAEDALTKVNKKAEEQYRKLIQSAVDYIASEKEKTKALALSGDATTEGTHYQTLENKARMDGLPITKDLTDKLHALAKEMAGVDAVYAESKFMHDFKNDTDSQLAQLKLQQDSFGLSGEALQAYTIAQTKFNEALKQHTVLSDADKQTIVDGANAVAHATQQVKNYTDGLALIKDVTKTAFETLFSDLKSGMSLWASFADAASKALDKIISKIAEVAIDSLFDGGASANNLFSGVTGVLGKLTGSSNSSGSVGGSTGGGGLSGLLNGAGSGLSGMLRQTSDFLGITTASPVSASDIGIGSGASAGASTGLFGSGISGLGAIGAIGGLASGAMQLFSGKGGAASTIGGIGSMIGAGVSLIPGIGQIAGPIISILSSVLPSLLGGTPQPINSSGSAGLDYGANGFSANGATYGPNGVSTTGALGSAGQSIQSVFDSFGGVTDPSKVYGARLVSSNIAYADGSSFNNQTSSLVSPTGAVSQWGQGSTDQDIGLGTLSGQIAVKSILEGAVGAITDNMRKALGNLATPDISVVAKTVTDIQAFDAAMASLNKTTNPMIDALAQIDQSFAGLYATAQQYGLDQGQIDVQKTIAQQKVGTDFGKTITDQLLDPETLALNQAGDARDALMAQNSTLLGAVQGYTDQAQNIELLYLKNRNAILDQYNAAAIAAAQAAADNLKAIVSSVDDYLKTLMPGGALDNQNATTHLAGLQSTYDQARQADVANPLDADTVNAFIKAGTDLATYAKDYYGGSQSYVDLQQQLIADGQQAQAIAGGQPTTAAGMTSNGMASTQTQFATLLDTVQQQADQNAALQAQIAQLNAQLARYLAQPR